MDLAPAGLPDRFRTQPGGAAALLLLDHTSDTRVDVKPQPVTAGRWDGGTAGQRDGGTIHLSRRAAAHKGLALLSARQGALNLLTLPALPAKAVRPRPHGDITVRWKPVSVSVSVPPPPRPPERDGASTGCRGGVDRNDSQRWRHESEKKGKRTEIKGKPRQTA